jgi:hypothetical protein
VSRAGTFDPAQEVFDSTMEWFREVEYLIPGIAGKVAQFFVDIPQGNELRMYDLADEYEKAGQQLGNYLSNVNPIFSSVADNWRGNIGAEQFADRLQQHLKKVSSAMDITAALQREVQTAAQNIELTKFMAATDLVMLAMAIYAAIMALLPTLGLSTIGAGAALAVCWAAIKAAAKKLLEELLAGGAKKIATEAAETGAKDVARLAAKDAAEQAGKDAAEQAAKDAAEQAGADGAQQAGADGAQQLANDAGQRILADVARQAERKATDQTFRELAKKVGFDAARDAREAAVKITEKETRTLGGRVAATLKDLPGSLTPRSLAARAAGNRAAEEAIGALAREAKGRVTSEILEGGLRQGYRQAVLQKVEQRAAAYTARTMARAAFEKASGGQIARELVSSALHGMETRGLQFAAFTAATEGAGQIYQWAVGHRSSPDWGELAGHTFSSFIVGAVGTPFRLGQPGIVGEVTAMVGGTAAVGFFQNLLFDHENWHTWFYGDGSLENPGMLNSIGHAAIYGLMGGANHLHQMAGERALSAALDAGKRLPRLSLAEAVEPSTDGAAEGFLDVRTADIPMGAATGPPAAADRQEVVLPSEEPLTAASNGGGASSADGAGTMQPESRPASGSAAPTGRDSMHPRTRAPDGPPAVDPHGESGHQAIGPQSGRDGSSGPPPSDGGAPPANGRAAAPDGSAVPPGRGGDGSPPDSSVAGGGSGHQALSRPPSDTAAELGETSTARADQTTLAGSGDGGPPPDSPVPDDGGGATVGPAVGTGDSGPPRTDTIPQATPAAGDLSRADTDQPRGPAAARTELRTSPPATDVGTEHSQPDTSPAERSAEQSTTGARAPARQHDGSRASEQDRTEPSASSRDADAASPNGHADGVQPGPTDDVTTGAPSRVTDTQQVPPHDGVTPEDAATVAAYESTISPDSPHQPAPTDSANDGGYGHQANDTAQTTTHPPSRQSDHQGTDEPAGTVAAGSAAIPPVAAARNAQPDLPLTAHGPTAAPEPPAAAPPSIDAARVAASPVGDLFRPDARPDNQGDLSLQELRQAATWVEPRDIQGVRVESIRLMSDDQVEVSTEQPPMIVVHVRDGPPQWYRAESFRPNEAEPAMADVARTVLRAGSQEDPHLVTVALRVPAEQVSRALAHELSHSLNELQALRDGGERSPGERQGPLVRVLGRVLNVLRRPQPVDDELRELTRVEQENAETQARLTEYAHLLRLWKAARPASDDRVILYASIAEVTRELSRRGYDVGELPSVPPDWSRQEGPNYVRPAGLHRVLEGPEHSTHDEIFDRPVWQAEGRRPQLGELIPLTAEAANKWRGLIADELARIVAPDREFGGLRVRLHGGSAEHALTIGRNDVVVRVEIVHPRDGTVVGDELYSFHKDVRGLVVQISSVSLRDYRGHGFLRQYHSYLEHWYAESGPVYLELRAVRDGRFAHALMGFGWNRYHPSFPAELELHLAAEREAARDDLAAVRRWLAGDGTVDLGPIGQRYGVDDPHLLVASLDRQVRAADATLAQARSHPFNTPGYPTPWDFLQTGWESGLRPRADTWIGQRAMERLPEWRGERHIDAGPPRPSVVDVATGPTDRFSLYADWAWEQGWRAELHIRLPVERAVEDAGGMLAPGADPMEDWDAFRERLSTELAGGAEPGQVVPSIRYTAELPRLGFEHAAVRMIDNLVARGYESRDVDLAALYDGTAAHSTWYHPGTDRAFELEIRPTDPDRGDPSGLTPFGDDSRRSPSPSDAINTAAGPGTRTRPDYGRNGADAELFTDAAATAGDEAAHAEPWHSAGADSRKLLPEDLPLPVAAAVARAEPPRDVPAADPKLIDDARQQVDGPRVAAGGLPATFHPDARPEAVAELSVDELLDAAAVVHPDDIQGIHVGAIKVVRADEPSSMGEPTGFIVVDVDHGDSQWYQLEPLRPTQSERAMSDVATTTLRTGTRDDPHLLTVAHQIDAGQVSRAVAHELAHSLTALQALRDRAAERSAERNGLAARALHRVLDLFQRPKLGDQPPGRLTPAEEMRAELEARLTERAHLLRMFQAAEPERRNMLAESLFALDRHIRNVLGHNPGVAPRRVRSLTQGLEPRGSDEAAVRDPGAHSRIGGLADGNVPPRGADDLRRVASPPTAGLRPDSRAAGVPDLTAQELAEAIDRVRPEDFAGGLVLSVTLEQRAMLGGFRQLIRVQLANGREHWFQPDVGHGMSNIAETHLRAGTPGDPHVMKVNDRVANRELSTAWVHEISHSVRLEDTASLGRATRGAVGRARGIRAAFDSTIRGIGLSDHDAHIQAREDERTHLQRLRGDATDPAEQDHLQRAIEGIEADLVRLKQPPEPEGLQPALPPQRQLQTADGRVIFQLPNGRLWAHRDPWDGWRDDEGRLHLKNDPLNSFRDDIHGHLHFPGDPPGTRREDGGRTLVDAAGDPVSDPLLTRAADHPHQYVSARSRRLRMKLPPDDLRRAREAEAQRTEFRDTVLQPLMDELGLTQRPEDLSDDILIDAAASAISSADPAAQDRVVELEAAAKRFHGPLLDAKRTADHAVELAIAAKLARQLRIAGARVIDSRPVGQDGRIPLIIVDETNSRLVALEPELFQNVRHPMADGMVAEHGSTAYLRDVLLHDQWFHDALSNHPDLLAALRRMAARGELTVDYRAIGVHPDESAWTRAFDTTGLDLSDLASKLPSRPRSHDVPDPLAGERIRQAFQDVAVAIERLSGVGQRAVEVLDVSTVQLTTRHGQVIRIELSLTKDINVNNPLDRVQIEHRSDGTVQLTLDHLTVDVLGAAHLDLMIARALGQIEAQAVRPGPIGEVGHRKDELLHRLNDRSFRSGALMNDGTAPRARTTWDEYELAHFEDLVARLDRAAAVEREPIERTIHQWIDIHGLRKGMYFADSDSTPARARRGRLHRLDLAAAVLSPRAREVLDQYRTVERAVDRELARARGILTSSTWHALEREKPPGPMERPIPQRARLKPAPILSRPLFWVEPEDWTRRGLMSLMVELEDRRLPDDQIAHYDTTRLEGVYRLVLDTEKLRATPLPDDQLARELHRVLAQAVDHQGGALSGRTRSAERGRAPELPFGFRDRATRVAAPLVSLLAWVSSSIGFGHPDLAVKAIVANASDIATGNILARLQALDAKHRVLEVMVASGLDRLGIHRQEAWRLYHEYRLQIEDLARRAGIRVDWPEYDISAPRRRWGHVTDDLREAARQRVYDQVRRIDDELESVTSGPLANIKSARVAHDRYFERFSRDSWIRLQLKGHPLRRSLVRVHIVERTAHRSGIDVVNYKDAVVLMVNRAVTRTDDRLHDALVRALEDVAAGERRIQSGEKHILRHAEEAYLEAVRIIAGAGAVYELNHLAGAETALLGGGSRVAGDVLASHLEHLRRTPLNEVLYRWEHDHTNRMSDDVRRNYANMIRDLADNTRDAADGSWHRATGRVDPGSAGSSPHTAAAINLIGKAKAAIDAGALSRGLRTKAVRGQLDSLRIPLGRISLSVPVRGWHAGRSLQIRVVVDDTEITGPDARLVRTSWGHWLLVVRGGADADTVAADTQKYVSALLRIHQEDVLPLSTYLKAAALPVAGSEVAAGGILAHVHGTPIELPLLVLNGFVSPAAFAFRHTMQWLQAHRTADIIANSTISRMALERPAPVLRESLDGTARAVNRFLGEVNQAVATLRNDPDFAANVAEIEARLGPIRDNTENFLTEVDRELMRPEGWPRNAELTLIPDRPHTYRMTFAHNAWRKERISVELRLGLTGDGPMESFIVLGDTADIVVVSPEYTAAEVATAVRQWLEGEVGGNRTLPNGRPSWNVRGTVALRDSLTQIVASGVAWGVPEVAAALHGLIPALSHADPILQGLFAGQATGGTAGRLVADVALAGRAGPLGDDLAEMVRHVFDTASEPQLNVLHREVLYHVAHLALAHEWMYHLAEITAAAPDKRPDIVNRWVETRDLDDDGPQPGGGAPSSPPPGGTPPHRPGSAPPDQSGGKPGGGAAAPGGAGTPPSGRGAASGGGQRPSATGAVPGPPEHPLGPDWARLNERSDGVIATRTPDSSAAAAVEMLSPGVVLPRQVIDRVGTSAGAADVATALGDLMGEDYRGAAVGDAAFDGLTLQGPWAAALVRPDGGHHWMIVDGADNDLVHVRDPHGQGSTYDVEKSQFLRAWSGEAIYRYDAPPLHWTAGTDPVTSARALAGNQVDPQQLGDRLGGATDPVTVAAALTDLTGTPWVGGDVQSRSPDPLSRQTQWAAELHAPSGQSRYVIVAGQTDDGRHLVLQSLTGDPERIVERSAFEREWTGRGFASTEPARLPVRRPAVTGPHPTRTGAGGTTTRTPTRFESWRRPSRWIGAGTAAAALVGLGMLIEDLLQPQPAAPPGGTPSAPPTPPLPSVSPPSTPPGGPPTPSQPGGSSPHPPTNPPSGGPRPGGVPPGAHRTTTPPQPGADNGGHRRPPPIHPVCTCGASWPRLDVHAGGAVAEITPGSSTAAAGQMLTHGQLSQKWLRTQAPDGARAPQLAAVLDEVSPHLWSGGRVDKQAVDLLVSRGPWAAEFEGAGGCLHYVVVDGVTRDGLLRIRDPFGHGSTYLMRRADFLREWDGVALFRDDPPSGIPVVPPDAGQTPAPPPNRADGSHRAAGQAVEPRVAASSHTVAHADGGRYPVPGSADGPLRAGSSEADGYPLDYAAYRMIAGTTGLGRSGPGEILQQIVRAAHGHLDELTPNDAIVQLSLAGPTGSIDIRACWRHDGTAPPRVAWVSVADAAARQEVHR